jgi:hypothetical protein
MPENLPALPPGSRSVVLSRATYEKIRAAAAEKIIPDSSDFETQDRAGNLYFRLRPRPGQTATPAASPLIFWPTLATDTSGETPTYTVTVTDGYVCELDRCAILGSDAITLHSCPSRLEVDGETLHPFPITVGQAVFVLVRELPSGDIGADAPDEPVDIVIASAATISTNYIPGDQDGEYYYKLAELIEVDGIAQLKYYLAGSHISHETGLTADVVFRDCNGDPMADPPVLGTQIHRATYLSGRLILLDTAIATRALAPATSIHEIPSCCWVSPPE